MRTDFKNFAVVYVTKVLSLKLVLLVNLRNLITQDVLVKLTGQGWDRHRRIAGVLGGAAAPPSCWRSGNF